MNNSIFNYTDYKLFIKDNIRANRSIRGYQNLLAKAAGCHASYFSGMLNSNFHLTLEQALRLGNSWGFNFYELDYLICLVLGAKTQDTQLKEHLAYRIQLNTNERAENERGVKKVYSAS